MNPPLEPAGRRAPAGDRQSADIVVGIPSFNNARTIGHVVRAAAAGLAKYFPAARGIIVNSDGGSKDGTPDAVAAAGLPAPAAILVSHELNAGPQARHALSRHPGQGQRVPDHLRDRASG